MNKEMFLVGLLVGLVVHEGRVLQQPQSVGGDAAAQPGGRGRGLGSHRRGQGHRGRGTPARLERHAAGPAGPGAQAAQEPQAALEAQGGHASKA